MAIYTMITYLGDSIGLTLTLAGVVGLIVSVGITVDSYVVYFERLKDEVRTGRTVRSSVDRGFVRSFKTILAADLVSLIAAAILYWQAIGSVRQFAFLLGLSTILDLLLSYFYMHPLVQYLARSRGLVASPEGRHRRRPRHPGGGGMRPDGRRHTLKDLYHEDTYYDFLHRRWRWVAISGALILISLLGFVLRDGLNLGLDFTGGTSWQLTAASGKNVSTGERAHARRERRRAATRRS